MSISKKKIFQEVLAKRGKVCGICGGSLRDEIAIYNRWLSGEKIKRTSANVDIDHICPKSYIKDHHWWHNIDNLQLAHRDCNNKKGNSLN